HQRAGPDTEGLDARRANEADDWIPPTRRQHEGALSPASYRLLWPPGAPTVKGKLLPGAVPPRRTVSARRTGSRHGGAGRRAAPHGSQARGNTLPAAAESRQASRDADGWRRRPIRSGGGGASRK